MTGMKEVEVTASSFDDVAALLCSTGLLVITNGRKV